MIEKIGILWILAIFVLFGAIKLFTILKDLSQKNTLAKDIMQHGCMPSEIVDAAWTGTDFKGLDEKLDNWTVKIRALAYEHSSSPFLHDFPRGLPVALAVLDDALSILKRGTPSEERPDGTRLRRLRGAINDMLNTLKPIGLAETGEVPAQPVFPDRITDHLNRVGFESEGEFILRRALLLAWVRYSGQAWYDDQPTFCIEKPVSKEWARDPSV